MWEMIRSSNTEKFIGRDLRAKGFDGIVRVILSKSVAGYGVFCFSSKKRPKLLITPRKERVCRRVSKVHVFLTSPATRGLIRGEIRTALNLRRGAHAHYITSRELRSLQRSRSRWLIGQKAAHQHFHTKKHYYFASWT